MDVCRLRFSRLLKFACFGGVFFFLPTAVTAANFQFRTANFSVQAPSAEMAKKVGLAAEYYRRKIAMEWLGKSMPQWYKRCDITVRVGQIGAGGATTFSFNRGQVFGWKMRVQGTLERILDSVIPHEVSHTVFACHFRRPLPRWADEGAATLVEHSSEQRIQKFRLRTILKNSQQIPLRQLLSMKQYPREMQQVLTLYAEGYALADFLVQTAGKKVFLRFLETAHRDGWDDAIARHYQFKNINALEKKWVAWIQAGSPPIDAAQRGGLLASTRRTQPVYRGRSPETKERLSRDRLQKAIAHIPGGNGSSLSAPDPSRTPRQHKTANLRENHQTPDKKWAPIIRRQRRQEGDSLRERLPRTSWQTAIQPSSKTSFSPTKGQFSPRGMTPAWSQFPHPGTTGNRSLF